VTSSVGCGQCVVTVTSSSLALPQLVSSWVVVGLRSPSLASSLPAPPWPDDTWVGFKSGHEGRAGESVVLLFVTVVAR
jgi:hypothetical protein